MQLAHVQHVRRATGAQGATRKRKLEHSLWLHLVAGPKLAQIGAAIGATIELCTSLINVVFDLGAPLLGRLSKIWRVDTVAIG